jgi:small-conductance mechanosensitive channel
MDPSFWQQHGNEISAGITLIVAVLLAIIVDRYLLGKAVTATQRMDTKVFSREARTRLRVIRRLVFVAIILIGVALALSQFAEIKRFATGVLASTAVLGLVIGFAARTVFANAVAGVLMAITQPIRIGDRVTVDEETGLVSDIALTYTNLDAGDGRILVIPNEHLVTNVVVNHSAGNPMAPIRIRIWLPPEADVEAARKALEGAGATAVDLVELTHEGATIEVRAPMEMGDDRERREAELRERAQDAVREAGLIGSAEAAT